MHEVLGERGGAEKAERAVAAELDVRRTTHDGRALLTSFPCCAMTSVVHAVGDPPTRPAVVIDAVQATVGELDVVVLTVVGIGGPPFAAQPPWSGEVDDASAESTTAHVFEPPRAFED